MRRTQRINLMVVETKRSNIVFHVLCVVIICVLASTVTFFAYQFLVSKANNNIMLDATNEGNLVVGLSQGFVTAYSDFEAKYVSGLLPTPATFRSHALELADLKTLVGGSLSSEVVGLPGRAIKKEPVDDEMRRQMLSLLNSDEEKYITSTLVKGGEVIHRSIWSFYAVDQACVNCHNTIQNLDPIDQWKLGDLMGAQVVEKNIHSQLLESKRDALGISVLIFFSVFAVAYCVALFIRQTFLAKELQFLATTDAMTGCINRREMYQRIRKLQEPVTGAVLMLDIDRFKAINDGYGHAAGDAVIQAFAEQVQLILNSKDWVARIGGEEFLIWLKDSSCQEAYSTAERILKQAEALSVVWEGKEIKFTVSIGLFVVEKSPVSKFDEWMSVADKRLYQAKNVGRNCIIS